MNEREKMAVKRAKEWRESVWIQEIGGFGKMLGAETAFEIVDGLIAALSAPEPQDAGDGIKVSDELMEALAADEHDRWSGQALTALNEMTDERRERWGRLAKIPYADLDEKNRELDRMQVRERLAIMAKFHALHPHTDVTGAVEELQRALGSGNWPALEGGARRALDILVKLKESHS